MNLERSRRSQSLNRWVVYRFFHHRMQAHTIHQIRLGTVDTFQGQEVKVVIISLVRNSGDFSSQSSIGFLKVCPRTFWSAYHDSKRHLQSVNRINVSLSRAKHGLYVLGNASNLRRNPTWNNILTTMEDRGLVGPELGIVCPRHPNECRGISKPKQLPIIAPEGGCLAQCEHQLSCGHKCPSVVSV